MNDSSCSFEDAVTASLTSGTLNAELQDHLSGCPICAEVVTAWKFMGQLAASSQPDLAPAPVVWQRAIFRQQEATQKRVALALAVTRFAAYGVFGCAFGVWLFVNRAGVRSDLDGMMPAFEFGEFGPASIKLLVYLTVVLLLINTVLSLRGLRRNSRTS